MKKIMMIISSLLLITAVFTGCGAAPKEEAPEIPASSDEASQYDALYPMTIQHAFGETVLEKKPEKIATISWGNQDVPLALGIVPVGVSMANYGVTDGSGLLPWTKDAFKSLGVENPVLFDDVAGLNYEAIYKVAPDVILASYSGITQEEYDLLSEIAPVIPYQEMPWQTFWRDQITENASAIGMKEEGEVLVKDLESLIAEKLTAYPELTGKSAAFFYFSPQDLSKFYIYLPADPRAAYLEDLQMVLPESVKKLQEENKSFAVELSAENVDLLTDVDLVITYGTEGLLETLQNDPLIGTMEAVKRGSVVVIEDGTPLAASGTPSALSIPATIDEYLKLMNDAAKKVQ
jgi:iron complex transport system substrate-binding protein